jgi:hypothetical protein
MPAIGAFAGSAAPAPQKVEKALIAVPHHPLLTRARAGQYLFHDLTGGLAATKPWAGAAENAVVRRIGSFAQAQLRDNVSMRKRPG